MKNAPIYDPGISYEQNFSDGPFGAFAAPDRFKGKSTHKSSLFGQPIELPFGIPAGPLLNGKFVKAALDMGFDIPVYKTVRTRKYPCAAWPNVLNVRIENNLTPEIAEKGLVSDQEYDPNHLSITNSFGVPSFDPEFWQKDLKEAVEYAAPGQVVVGSFQGTLNPQGDKKKYIEDFVLAAKLVKETGAKILEVNLSCPNEGTSHLLCFDIHTTQSVVESIKNEIGDTPLVIKISYYKDTSLLTSLVREVGGLVDGIDAINTIPAKIVDSAGNQALPGSGRLISGVCGRAIKWAGLQMVRQLYELRETNSQKFTIFGTGGVTIKEDYDEYRDAGADVVMSATGAMWNPFLAQQIKKVHNI